MHNFIIHEVPRMKHEEWAAALRAARKEVGFSRNALADAMQISLRNIRSWENGDTTPPAWVQTLLLEKLPGD